MEGSHAVIAAVAVAAVVVIVVIAAVARRNARPAARRGSRARRRSRPFWRHETPRDLADRWRAAAHGPQDDPDSGDFQPTQMMAYADAVKAGFAEPANRPPSRADGEAAQAQPRAAEKKPSS